MLPASLLWGLSLRRAPGGALKWQGEYASYFRGHRVAILPDNDMPGGRHAVQVAQSLHGIARTVRIVPLPNLEPKGDVSDWLDAGGTTNALTSLIEAAADFGNSEDTGPIGDPARLPREPVGVIAANVQPERVVWLSPGRLAAGKATMLDGDPGLGKSTLSLEWAARITRGDALPGGKPSDPRGVVVLSAEDGIADSIVPRLMAAGADLSRVFILTGIATANDEDDAVTVPSGLDAVERAIHDMDAALVVIDPLVAFLGGDVNSNRDQDVRRAMKPLATMLERTGCAGLLLRHLNKATGGLAVYRGVGSIGIIGAARFGLLAARDPDDDNARIIAPVKVNIGPESPALRYRLVVVPETGVARIEWDSAPVTFDAGALLAAAAGGDEEDGEPSALGEAQDWLRTFLKDGQQRAPGVIAQARKDGIAERTLHRAKKALGIQSRRDGPDWVWLPPASNRGKGVDGSLSRSVGNVGNLDENPRHNTKNEHCQHCQGRQHCQDCQGLRDGNVGAVPADCGRPTLCRHLGPCPAWQQAGVCALASGAMEAAS